MKRFQRLLKRRQVDVAEGCEGHARLGEAPRCHLGVDIVDRPQRRLAVGKPVSAFTEVAPPFQLGQGVVNRSGINFAAQMTDKVVRATTAVDQRRHELVQAAPQQRLADFGEHQHALAIQRFDMEMRLETRPMKHDHRLLVSTSLAVWRKLKPSYDRITSKNGGASVGTSESAAKEAPRAIATARYREQPSKQD